MSDDQFQSERLIASGPAAKVFVGVETATGRKVLLKSLLEEQDTPFGLDREKLQLLAPVLLQIRHPQIAGLITLVPAEDEFALIYDYMPGKNVFTFSAERRPSAADMRALAVQLMHVLLMGEQLRQPHGDPKPSNLIIADHPGGGLFVQVQDWGLSLTRAKHPPETLWFRAPELHDGGRPSSQSDLFTVAASLFCLATNSAPAQGDDPAELVQQWRAFDVSRSLRHLRPDLDQPLIDWLTWLLRLDPQQRPQSVAQALDVLMAPIHSGYVPVPAQAPEPQPAPVPQPAPAPQPSSLPPAAAPVSVPKPQPVAPPKFASSSSSAKAAATPPQKKSSGSRATIAVVVNLAALVVVGFFLWPIFQKGTSEKTVAASNGGSGKPAVPAASSSIALAEKSAGPAAPAPAKGSGTTGRFVRVAQPGYIALNLAEVQVFSGEANVAMQGKATQSSVGWKGFPELAIDGNTNGDMGTSKSVMHTDDKLSDPWWQVDLGSELPLHTIVLWNRTDGKYGERTKNLTVQVLDAQQKVVWEKKGLPTPLPRLTVTVGE